MDDDGGLTLIEVMIAMLFFSVGIVAVASLQTNGTRGMVAARQRLSNTAAACAQLELIMAMGYGDALAAEGGHSASSMTWEIIEDSPVPGTKRVHLTLQRTAEGRQGGVFFDTVLSRGHQ
jgi:hypothetical protein